MNPLVIANLDQLLELNSQNRFLATYHELISWQVNPSLYIPSRVVSPDYSHSTVYFDLSMQQEIHGISDHLLTRIVPSTFNSKYGHIKADKIFFTDGSLINGSTGFGVFNEFFSASYSLQFPCSVYIAELAAIHWALDSVASRPVEHFYIVTDSLSSVTAIRSVRQDKYSPYFLEKIREILSTLSRRCYSITFVWVPSHCSIMGNEKADSLAKVGAVEGDIYQRQIAFNEFYFIVRQNALVNWQRKWSEDELGRWLHSIIPKVSLKSWFKGLDISRDFIRTFNRIMSNHCSLSTSLCRVNLSDTNVCGCGNGFHDIEHLVWSCEMLSFARTKLIDSLRARGKQPNVPVRDVLALVDIEYMHEIYSFLKSVDIRV
jgi:ribonuclease HI